MTQKELYFGRGKLLLTSEYFVLDGALALALPTKLGQHMEIETTDHEDASIFQWVSKNSKGEVWFEAQLSPNKFHVIETNDKPTAIALQTILRSVKPTKPFVSEHKITKVTTELDFPIEWGLGSSSTLIYAVAKWAGMNPFELLQETFKGSGYDIACAGEEQPILYQIENKVGKWETADFKPAFSKQLYFVYLGKKQNSRSGIKHYKSEVKNPLKYTHLFTQLTKDILATTKLSDFERLLTEHEHMTSKILNLERSQTRYFADYEGGIVKSLGAWGGDFVLVSSSWSPEETKAYFNNKGFDIVLPYRKLIA